MEPSNPRASQHRPTNTRWKERSGYGDRESVRGIFTSMDVLGSIDFAALNAACERYGVAELAVFGSVAAGDAGPDSDVDLLYVLRDGVHLGWAINDLADDLENVLGRPVDLVSKQALHARLRDVVLAQAQVVYAA